MISPSFNEWYSTSYTLHRISGGFPIFAYYLAYCYVFNVLHYLYMIWWRRVRCSQVSDESDCANIAASTERMHSANVAFGDPSITRAIAIKTNDIIFQWCMFFL